MNSKVNYIGKRFTWDELVELFPDTWIAVTDCVMDGPNILDCVLLEVFDDDGVEDKMPKFIRKGVKCRRTTIGMGVGYIHGRVVENKNA
jgi:hypothetical protein